MGQGLRTCTCPTPASAGAEGGSHRIASKASGPELDVKAAGFVVAGGGSGDNWAPPSAAWARSCGSTLALRLDGGAGTSWLASRGCAVRLAWSSATDPSDLKTPPVVLPDVLPLPARVVQVAAGESHALLLVLDPAPRVYSIGANDHGQLGIGDTRPRRDSLRAWEVKALDTLSLIGSVACGGNVSLAVSQRGDVWSWGRAEPSGALGLGDLPVACVPTPTSVGQLRRKVHAVQAATTGWTSFVLTHLGGVMSWGGGLCGVHGHGHQEDEPTAKAIRELSGAAVVQIALGPLHALALSSSGEVFAWGRVTGAFGPEVQLQLTPKHVDALQGIRIVQVAVGCEHNLALSATGEVYGWGAHSSGAFGCMPVLRDPSQMYAMVHLVDLQLGRVKEVGCGTCHSLFWATSIADSDQAQGNQREASTLWICGQGVPATEHPARQLAAKGGLAGKLARGLLPKVGSPLKLTRVDVKRVLEMFAAP
mmetsp:Transcript_82369/g.266749  ORF Transcript_82369/g.266749 Transcript_82369/m.266749 type:complete len:479 (+) Transcript_82369:201-1637(+)